MFWNDFRNKGLLLITLATFSLGQQQEITLQLLQQVQDKIDALQKSQGTCQTGIDSANQRLTSLSDKEARDAANALSSVDNLNVQVNKIGADVNTFNGRVTVLENRVVELEAFITESNQKITRLENINAIWKANFKVVNSTFTVLRNKLKFIIPVMRLPVFAIPNFNPAQSTNTKRKRQGARA